MLRSLQVLQLIAVSSWMRHRSTAAPSVQACACWCYLPPLVAQSWQGAHSWCTLLLMLPA